LLGSFGHQGLDELLDGEGLLLFGIDPQKFPFLFKALGLLEDGAVVEVDLALEGSELDVVALDGLVEAGTG
jgi:hypothetical protein